MNILTLYCTACMLYAIWKLSTKQDEIRKLLEPFPPEYKVFLVISSIIIVLLTAPVLVPIGIYEKITGHTIIPGP